MKVSQYWIILAWKPQNQHNKTKHDETHYPPFFRTIAFQFGL